MRGLEPVFWVMGEDFCQSLADDICVLHDEVRLASISVTLENIQFSTKIFIKDLKIN
jgi:hypothetical protein